MEKAGEGFNSKKDIKIRKKLLLNRRNNYMICKMRLVGICYKGGQTLA